LVVDPFQGADLIGRPRERAGAVPQATIGIVVEPRKHLHRQDRGIGRDAVEGRPVPSRNPGDMCAVIAAKHAPGAILAGARTGLRGLAVGAERGRWREGPGEACLGDDPPREEWVAAVHSRIEDRHGLPLAGVSLGPDHIRPDDRDALRQGWARRDVLLDG